MNLSKRYFHDRWEDGVSPVIATILMIAITIVLAAIVVVWALSFAPNDTITPKGSMTIKVNPSNDFTATVLSMISTLNIEDAKYYLVDNEGRTVEQGKVSDINDGGGNVRFDDADNNGKITPEDYFILKGNNNGGNCDSGYKFTIKFIETNEVVMSRYTP